MTDNEIIKALECCLIECGECTVCPLKHIKSVKCLELLNKNAYNLINRQKEEIEKLKKEKDEMHKDVIVAEEYAWSLKTAKSEAIREFARRLIEEINTINYKEYNNYLDTFNTIERVAEEMECGDND